MSGRDWIMGSWAGSKTRNLTGSPVAAKHCGWIGWPAPPRLLTVP
jgi:hypothetical protein